jgi:DNA mismatch repair protein MutL
MANRIKILPENLANKIAAGEVVERPASVVKELVENSIDAEAKKIIIAIERGGRKLIRVSDDGMGMSEDDAITAFERHATSKIASIEDLNTIATLGFRGEALPSIASVSQLEMITRAKGNLSGTKIKFHGGVLKDVSAHPSPIGTTVSVQRLFFNTPARYKFLKSIATEMTHIIDIVTQQSIAHPDISFTLSHNGRKSLDFPSASDLKGRLRDVLGKQVAENLIDINSNQKNISIKGFIGKPSIARKDKRYQYIYVNNRHIRNNTISGAIYNALGDSLPKGRHPILVLFIDVDPNFVDVNVHPTKAEIRFSNNSLIYKSVLGAISQQTSFEDKINDFYGSDPSESVDTKKYHLHTPEKLSKAVDINFPRSQSSRSSSYDYTPSKPSRKEIEKYREILQDHRDEEIVESDKNYSIVGQVHNCYIILQTPDGMMIVDQHVAHERLLYENAKAALRENPLASQRLLFPVTMELSPLEYSVFSESEEVFEKLGFEIKNFSDRTIVVETVPSNMKNQETAKALRDILDMESEDVADIVDDKTEKIIINYSCKSAIKKGQKLSFDEMAKLINDWLKTKNPYTCPHGRPIVLNLTLKELDRKFGRSGG